MDINAIAQQLINALRRSTESAVEFQGLQRRNFFEDTMNRGAARGTLYSTAGANQQSRYDATTYLPGVTDARQQQQQQEIKIKGDVLDTQRKIDSINRSAKELNAITFDHLLD